jgi:hypothetical protein
MSSLAKNTKATVMPCLRYRNASAAIEWLCKAFGFEKHLVVPGEGWKHRARAAQLRQRHDYARIPSKLALGLIQAQRKEISIYVYQSQLPLRRDTV